MESRIKLIRENINRFFKQGDIVIKLILILTGVYLFQFSLHLIEFVFRLKNHPLSSTIEHFFYLGKIKFETLFRIYTLISYQFFHDGFLHLFVNTVLLFFFGRIVLTQLGLKKFIPLYFLGGIFSGLVYLFIRGSSSEEFEAVAGSSASIAALIGTAVILKPDLKIKLFFVFDISLKWIVSVFALLNFIYLLNPETTGGSLLHLSGLAFGVFFILLDQRGILLSKPFNKTIDFALSLFRKKQSKRPLNNPNEKPKKTDLKKEQEYLEAILAKISTNGYESLTKAEKEILFKSNAS